MVGWVGVAIVVDRAGEVIGVVVVWVFGEGV